MDREGALTRLLKLSARGRGKVVYTLEARRQQGNFRNVSWDCESGKMNTTNTAAVPLPRTKTIAVFCILPAPITTPTKGLLRMTLAPALRPTRI